MTEPTPIELREAEVSQYQSNIDMYTAIIATLPSEWPEHLLMYKGALDKHSVISSVENLDDVVLLGDLWAREAAEKAIRTETIEMRKSMAILAALRLQSM
jgi:hypothetical protein